MKLPHRVCVLIGLALLIPIAHAADFDGDGDGDVDLLDAGDFALCMNGPDIQATAGCAEVYDADAEADIDLADVQGMQLNFGRLGTAMVRQFTFTGTDFTAVAVDCPSEFSCSDYGTPHWLDSNLDGDAEDSGEHAYPSSYVRDGTVKLTSLRFGVMPGGLDLDDVPVRGFGPDGVIFEATGYTSGTQLIVPGTVTATTSLPNAVAYYPTFEIAWEVALDGVHYYPAGTSRNPMYVTYNDPLGAGLESYFYISTQAAHGQAGVQDVVDAIWEEFTDRQVLNVYGEPLGYYRGQLCAADCTYYSADALVYHTNSQCGGWADLLIQCIRTQGISGTQFITIEPRGTPYLPGDCGSFPQPAAGFIVKNYFFQDASMGPCEPYPLNFNDPCGFYSAWTTPTVTDLPGLPGQDNPNPASWFARHFIVKFNGQYYDPAYGAGPFSGTTDQATLAWERGAMAAYYGRAQMSPTRLGVRSDDYMVRETFFDN